MNIRSSIPQVGQYQKCGRQQEMGRSDLIAGGGLAASDLMHDWPSFSDYLVPCHHLFPRQIPAYSTSALPAYAQVGVSG